jgi:hypothetical protein
MGRRLYTEEEKLEAKKKANERNKQWQKDHKETFGLYQKEYYLLNKERLDARNSLIKKQKRELIKQQKNAEN